MLSIEELRKIDITKLEVSDEELGEFKEYSESFNLAEKIGGMPIGPCKLFEQKLEDLYNKEYKVRVVIDDKLKEAIDNYYAQYGAK